MSRRTQTYRVPPMITADSVYYALSNRLARDPEYQKAVIRSYVDVKMARGKTRTEAAVKLEVLEREYPHLAPAFHAVRAEFSLPPSRILPPVATSSNPLGRATTSAASTSRPVNGRASVSTGTPSAGAAALRRTATAPRPAPTPRVVEDGDELPPPPYTRTDPEPDSTRILQEHLAAEAQANARNEATAAAPTTSATTTYAPPPTSPPHSVPTVTYPAPTSPPPQSTHSQPPSRSRPLTPDAQPSDEEGARAWEESQFEEAKRMSLAAQREQEELEEAVRLSLAEAEQRAVEQSRSDDVEQGSSRRVSSYNPQPMAQGSGGGHRRVLSDAGDHGRPDMQGMQDLKTGIQNIDMGDSGFGNSSGTGTTSSIPGAWSFGESSHGHGSSGLLGEDEEYLAPPTLTPSKTGGGPSLQSKNPFLSVQEREEIEAGGTVGEEDYLADADFASLEFPTTTAEAPGSSGEMATPTLANTKSLPSTLSPPQTTASGSPQSSTSPRPAQHASNTSLRDSAGSARTQINYHTPPKASHTQNLPPSDEEIYAPPPGPPPPHLRIDAGTVAPRLPPRTASVVSPSMATPTWTPTPAAEEPSAVARGKRPLPRPSPTGAGSQQRTVSGAPSLPREMIPPSSLGWPTQPTFGGGETDGVSASEHAVMSPTIPVVNGEDPLEMLKEYDTVFLVDDSASMAGERWEQARVALMGVADIASRYDQDGVDLYFLNSKRVGKELRGASEVEDVFAGLVPKGNTPTGARLEVILREYMTRLERSTGATPMSPGAGGGPSPFGEEVVRPMNLIVITDGAPTDDPESVLIAIAKRLDRSDYPVSQVGIQFMQIGNDPEAREALQELDDGLAAAHGVRDMVDTVLFSGEEMTADLIIKALLGGINRRLDRR